MRFRFLLPVVLAMLMAACGGGSGGGSDGPAVRTGTVTLQGTVTKGPVGDAEVCAIALVAGVRNGDLRLTAGSGYVPAGGNFCVLTHADGSFVATVPDSYQGDLLLEARGGFFCTDETNASSTGGCGAGGVTLSLGNGSMRTLVAIPASGTVTAQVTPLSAAAVDSAGSLLGMGTFSARFATLAGQLGLPQGVTPTTPADRSTHPYLQAATAHLLGGGTLDQVLAALRQGSNTFLPAPAPVQARVASAIAIDFDGAMAGAVTRGKNTYGALVSNLSVTMHAIWRGNCYDGAPAGCPLYPNQRSFEGQSYPISDEVRQVVDNTGGIERVREKRTRRFVSFSPYMVVGEIDGDGRYSVTTERGALPFGGKIGEGGLFRKYTTYTDAGKATVYSTTTENWSIEANTASTLFGCFDGRTRLAASGAETRAKECFRIGNSTQGVIDGPGGLLAIYEDAGLTSIYEGDPDWPAAPTLRTRTPSNVTVNFDAAAERAMREGLEAQADGIGTAAGQNLRFSIDTFLLAGNETFEGASRMANNVKRILTTSANGQASTSRTEERVLFGTAPFKVYGKVATEGNAYSVTTEAGTLPTAGRLGETGLFYRYSTWRNSLREELLSTTTVTWSLEADTATTLLGCFNSVVLGPSGAERRRASECFPIDTTGRFTGSALHTLRAVYTVDGLVTAYE